MNGQIKVVLFLNGKLPIVPTFYVSLKEKFGTSFNLTTKPNTVINLTNGNTPVLPKVSQENSFNLIDYTNSIDVRFQVDRVEIICSDKEKKNKLIEIIEKFILEISSIFNSVIRIGIIHEEIISAPLSKVLSELGQSYLGDIDEYRLNFNRVSTVEGIKFNSNISLFKTPFDTNIYFVFDYNTSPDNNAPLDVELIKSAFESASEAYSDNFESYINFIKGTE
jgi:hypothetical protein